ncbi:MAG: GntR family transcriptional regulator [Paenibacillaceae bacterium]|jgi:GntR family transcriptional repressor for pyruvate dehydrogenase complex|nr:GntR family transcriptional regulator [Paenibacillaceae bacterium]
MEITRIVHRKNYEQITDEIKRHIVNGTLAPGHKLPSTKQLADDYGVGRSTVREALSALKAMGLIDIRHGEGCFVRRVEAHEIGLPVFNSLLIDRDTVLELLEARKSLEVSNAVLAASKRSPDDLRKLESILDEMGRSLGDEKQSEQTDLQFHQALSEATGNSIMQQLLKSISGQMEAAIRETRRLWMYSDASVAKRLWKEHRAIFEAVSAMDPKLAERRMRTHLDHVEEVIRRHLR